MNGPTNASDRRRARRLCRYVVPGMKTLAFGDGGPAVAVTTLKQGPCAAGSFASTRLDDAKGPWDAITAFSKGGFSGPALSELLSAAALLLRREGLLVIEGARREEPPKEAHGLALIKRVHSWLSPEVWVFEQVRG
jgi:hypothetical protein